MRALALTWVFALFPVLLIPAPAFAESDYFGDDAPEDKITFRMDKSRTTRQRLLITSLFTASAVFGGIGVYYHLDSRSKSDELSSMAEHTGMIYDEDKDAAWDGAYRSRRFAIGSYTIGGLFLIAGVTAIYLTDPGSRVVAMDNDSKSPPKPVVPVSVIPVSGGAMVGSAWSF